MLPKFAKNPSIENRDITINVGGIEYILEIFFINSSGFFRVQKNSFKQLEFRDSILNPFLSISLILKNTNNEIESSLIFISDNPVTDAQFEFKGNSDEFVLLNLKPVIETNGNFDKKDQFEYKLQLTCFIKDEEEFREGENTYKIFELIDVKYRELMYPTKHWSTNNLLSKSNTLLSKNISQLSDEERAVYTGDAIKDIIETFVSDKVINYDRWDRGSSKLFYSSPNGSTPINSIEYLIDNHLSTDNSDPCFLREDKFGKLNFLSLKDIFKGIVNNNIFGPEVIGSYELPIDSVTEGNSIGRNTVKDLNPLNSNLIINKYFYLNFSSTSSLKRLRSTNVVNYDFKNKKFSLYKSQGDISSSIEYFNDNYLNVIPSKSTKIAFTPSKKVLDKNLITTLYSTTQDQNVAFYEGRNEVLRNLMYLSNSLEIEINGNINLRSGKFINILRNSGIDSSFERKIQGLYFILETNHILNNNEYISTAVAAKPYTT